MDRTDALLKELHETFLPSMPGAIAEQAKAPVKDLELLGRGEFLREAIFYGGESAYSFQYRDFAPLKYAADDPWLKANRGFSIFDARTIAQAIARLQEQKLKDTVGPHREDLTRAVEHPPRLHLFRGRGCRGIPDVGIKRGSGAKRFCLGP
jgi:hypothetical protein